MAEQRYAQVHRKTNETDISLTLTLDGNGKAGYCYRNRLF